ncbi:MAG TPA: tetratricopeptide repeat protein [Candidatus Eisenbacteria bacterium]|nr:tetratricopeptide repeat protein [Candidatus Eisenbacteria bacterium]
MTAPRSRRRARGKPIGHAPRTASKGSLLPALLASVAVFAVAYLTHASALRFEFLTSWDDPTYVVDNPWIRGFTAENLRFVFTQPYFANYLPLHLVSYMLDYTLWGLSPFGFHLQSVLLHAINAVLALWVVRRLFGSLALASIAAILYAVHPSQVEAIAWVSIRKDLLSTAFLLLTLLFYLDATGKAKLRALPYTASVVCFVLGLFSKVSIAALPAFLLVLDAFPRAGARRRPWKEAIVTKIPYGIAALVLVYVNNLAQVKAQAAYAQDPIRYLMVKGHAVWNYLSLLTGIPRGRPIYDTPQFSGDPPRAAVELAGLIVLPVVFWLAERRGWRPLSWAAAWILILLLPAILFPLVTYMADRYLYAPSLGFCWAVAAGILALSARAGGQAVVTRGLVAAGLTAVPFALFTLRTLEYMPVWRNSETLWTHTIRHSRDFRARNNLAQVRLAQKRYEDAERLYREASAIDNIVSHQGLATVYYGQRRYDDAQRSIERAFEIAATKRTDPADMAELHYTRGAIHWVRNERAQAIEDWESALRILPGHAGARQWLATARGESPAAAGP